MTKEREINDTPNDKIDPDEVRINKLERIVEEMCKIYEKMKSGFPVSFRGEVVFEECLNDINALSQTEKYTTEEIKDALCGHFYHNDIIIFLLKPYMENL